MHSHQSVPEREPVSEVSVANLDEIRHPVGAGGEAKLPGEAVGAEGERQKVVVEVVVDTAAAASLKKENKMKEKWRESFKNLPDLLHA